MPENSPAENSPHSFGQYQLIEKIAQGGMAEIFKGKALDTEGLERPVVIKRILPHIAASPEFVDMLIDEAKIAVHLSHGNIAQVYDLGKVADDYFIVMEYVEGKTLSQIMKRLRTDGRFFPIPHAAAMCAEIASGLDYMHRKTDDKGHPLHIVHRDISPQNVILSTAGTVKIIDFGIARAKTRISTTDSGVLKGKFAYMSPEHAEGERLDYRTDIFSLGVILFELLTGQRLFKGKNNAETIRKVKRAKVPLPSGLRPEVPKALDEIILKALQKDRQKRYASADALHTDLIRFLVTYHPQFSARDLTAYLHEIFPELAPFDSSSQEETHSRYHATKKTKTSEPEKEHTVAADSEVIRQKLKETEVFDVSSPSSVVQIEERTSKIRRSKIRWKLAGILGGVVLLTVIGGFLATRYFKHKTSQPPPQTKPIPSTGLSTKKLQESIVKPKLPEPLPKPQPLLPPPSPLPPPPQPPPQITTTGFLTIESQPPGALIFLNDVETNQRTPATLKELPPGKEQRIGLHLDQYKYWEGRARIDGGKTVRLAAALELNVGDLQVNSLPEGAEVVLNGVLVGKTPYRTSNIPPDTPYRVEVRLSGYEPWNGDVKIFGGKREVVNAPLKKIRPVP